MAQGRTDAVLYERVDNVAIITMNRPQRRNALSQEVREGVFSAYRRLEADDQVRAAVLTGAGSSFCAGADLNEMSDNGTAVPDRNYVPMLNRNVWVRKPVIAAVNGHALGGGFLLAQTCDLAIACDDATFGMPETKWSRGAPWSVPLLHIIGQRLWLELALVGEPIPARRAYEIGLVNKVVAREELLGESLRWAKKISANAPLTVQATKKMVYMATEMGRTAAWDTADALFVPVYSSADAQEGPRAFREKRQPIWQGK